MPCNDLLIKLYEINFGKLVAELETKPEITFRKPIGTDRYLMINWAQQNFPKSWVSEIETALANTPTSCIIAQQHNTLLGFACYDATALGFFGPIGVIGEAQGQGIGRRLAIHCFHEMWLKGYGYAIVGMAASADFYRKITSVIEIPDSDPGLYRMTKALQQK
jgi:GNAT superfamily N-acetyltransferase